MGLDKALRRLKIERDGLEPMFGKQPYWVSVADYIPVFGTKLLLFSKTGMHYIGMLRMTGGAIDANEQCHATTTLYWEFDTQGAFGRLGESVYPARMAFDEVTHWMLLPKIPVAGMNVIPKI